MKESRHGFIAERRGGGCYSASSHVTRFCLPFGRRGASIVSWKSFACQLLGSQNLSPWRGS